MGKALPGRPSSVDFPKTFPVRISEHDGRSLRSCVLFSGQWGRELAQERSPSRAPGHPAHRAFAFRASFFCRWKNRGHNQQPQEGASET